MLWRFEPLKKSLQMLLLKALSLYAIRNADQVISLSEATSRLLGKFSPQCKSEILYHGISSNFNPLAPRPEAAGNEPYFLFVSNLYVYKGLEFIVEALACKPELPKVFIAGHAYDRDYVEWVKQKALKAGVAERMIYLDNIPYRELPGWYANATAMVYSSWCENCPNILLEAMACGCPVIAMNTGPMPEICGEAGYFARPFDGKALADAMQNALKNSGSKSEAAKKRAAEFTWQKAMQRHKEIFSKFGQKK
jgi:glycosyltransferase involved in cell wall biosynthesis